MLYSILNDHEATKIPSINHCSDLPSTLWWYQTQTNEMAWIIAYIITNSLSWILRVIFRSWNVIHLEQHCNKDFLLVWWFSPSKRTLLSWATYASTWRENVWERMRDGLKLCCPSWSHMKDIHRSPKFPSIFTQ